MNIHEYQAKGLFAKYGIPVPQGYLALTPQEAVEAAGKLEAPWVVKAQVHAGGRGKAGGVKVCKTVEEVEAAAKAIIGMKLVTKQTGEAGKIVHKVWVESGTNIARELYLAVVLDRTAGRLACMASPDGGMDIETVAAETPDHIFTCKLDAAHEIWPFQARKLFFGCGLDAKQVGEGVKMLQGLVKLAKEEDAVLVEINPLCVNAEGHLVALDAKVNFDDAALKRHPAIAALDDPEEADPLELKAKEAGVNYVHLGGEVGTMVNGAGLAMATMDAIKQAGSTPANFLDAGGGANEDMVAAGFSLMLEDPNVKGVLINIFGGILRCDIVAQGVVNAAKRTGMTLPLVIRMEGTNVEEGRRILKESGLNYHPAASMSEAARKIAEITGRA
ncbi:MAG: ADP-forming succinate--CoA ligase subunit beta [Desulfovibrio sp.]|nr:ADP-forming succinate--CoA ligase subunit beta [Desulfovibrio sp.]MBR5051517.1 ADP-forming succinate--CoA ligase subunit beta [Desulfovibrio sp.]